VSGDRPRPEEPPAFPGGAPPPTPAPQASEGPRPFARFGADTLIFRRDSGARPLRPPGNGDAFLAGDLSRLDAADLINFVNVIRMTGMLLVADGAHERALYFYRGEVVFAATNDRDERLGEVLVRLGRINHRQLEEVEKHFKKGKTRIGRFLVSQELISPQTLWEGLREQVREIFFGCLDARRGEFCFFDAKRPEEAELNLSLTTRNLLLEGVQRKDELEHYRKRIPDDDIIFGRRSPLPSKELSPNERKVLRVVDGKTSISQLAMLCQIDRFTALKTLFHLTQAGFVEMVAVESAAPRRVISAAAPSVLSATVAVSMPAAVSAPAVPIPPATRVPEAPRAPSSEVRLREVIGVFNGIYAEILGSLAAKMPIEGTLKTLNAFFQNLEPAVARLFRGVRIGREGTLDAGALIRNFADTPSEGRENLLTSSLKEFFFFCIFEATSRLDPAGEQALLERVQALQNDLRS